MKWVSELTVNSVDFDPVNGAVELCMRAFPGTVQAFGATGDIVSCDVSFSCQDGIEVRHGKRYRVTVEEVDE